MNAIKMQQWLVFATGCLALGFLVALHAGPAVSQSSSHESRFEYRVIEVPPETRSIQAALTEYGNAGWELAAFEMGELQAPRLIFKKGASPAP